MAIVIREAVEGDYEALCGLIDQVDKLHRDRLPRRFRATKGPARSWDFFLNAISASDIGFFVAEIEHSLAGFVHVIVREAPEIPIFVPRRYAVVDSLAVRAALRRRGIGRALMDKAHDWSTSKGATSIELNVYDFNQQAMAFYRALGYEIISHRMSRSLDGEEVEGKERS